MLEKLEKEFNLHKEVINSLPINNEKNKKQYALEIDKLINMYEEKAKKIYTEVEGRLSSYFELKPTDYSDKEKSLDSFALTLMRTNNLSTSYEKLKLDKIIYLLSNFASEDFEQINNKLLSFINIFKSIGIVLNKNDFNYTKYVAEYMESFFKYDIKSDELKKSFEEIYWRCPNVIVQLELNLRYLYYKNEKVLNKYIQKTNEVILKQFKNGERNIIDNYAYFRRKLDDLKFNDKNDLTYRFVNNELSIDNCTNDKVDKIINELVSVKNDDLFIVLIKLKNTLVEYKNYLKYLNLINTIKSLYKDNLEKNFMQTRIKKICKLENKLFKLNKKSINSDKRTKVNKFELEVDNTVKEIKMVYDEIDDNIFKVVIKMHLADNSTIFKALLLSCQYYSILAKNLNIDDVSENKIAEEINNLYYFVLNPNNNLINNQTLLSDNDLGDVIINNYRMFGVNLTKEMMDNGSLDNLINNIDIILTNYRINKLNISISDLQNLTEFKKIKENLSK